MQLQTSSATGVPQYKNMFDCFAQIIRSEGPGRLYRGLAAPIMQEGPKRATKFAANDFWGKTYRNLLGPQTLSAGNFALLTGCSAGATESFVVTPFELVKIRLQDKASASLYSGPLDVVRKVVRDHGVGGIYKGMESTFWRHVAWNGGYFGCIFQVKELLPKPTVRSYILFVSPSFSLSGPRLGLLTTLVQSSAIPNKEMEKGHSGSSEPSPLITGKSRGRGKGREAGAGF